MRERFPSMTACAVPALATLAAAALDQQRRQQDAGEAGLDRSSLGYQATVRPGCRVGSSRRVPVAVLLSIAASDGVRRDNSPSFDALIEVIERMIATRLEPGGGMGRVPPPTLENVDSSIIAGLLNDRQRTKRPSRRAYGGAR
jgi:hypothetical protein